MEYTGRLLFTPYEATEKVLEWDTVMCAHCNGIVVIQHGSGRVHSSCDACGGRLCDDPKCRFNPLVIRGCTPFLQKMEIREEAARKARISQVGYDNI